MIDLYGTRVAVNNTTVVLISRPCSVKKLAFFGASKVELFDAATIAAANAAKVACTASGYTRANGFICELQGTTNEPHDVLTCLENEVINCTNGLTAVGTGADGVANVRVFTMGNPAGSQGS